MKHKRIWSILALLVALVTMVIVYEMVFNSRARALKEAKGTHFAIDSVLIGQVLHVKDGDTFSFRDDTSGLVVDVRLNAIDAPELSQPYGVDSKLKLEALCLQGGVELTVLGVDKYKRTIARVKCHDVDVQQKLVREGLAWVYDQYAQNDLGLYTFQQQAVEQRAGLWQDATRIQPWEWRRIQR